MKRPAIDAFNTKVDELVRAFVEAAKSNPELLDNFEAGMDDCIDQGIEDLDLDLDADEFVKRAKARFAAIVERARRGE